MQGARTDAAADVHSILWQRELHTQTLCPTGKLQKVGKMGNAKAQRRKGTQRERDLLTAVRVPMNAVMSGTFEKFAKVPSGAPIALKCSPHTSG